LEDKRIDVETAEEADTGKTVMSPADFEALFFGDDEFDFKEDLVPAVHHFLDGDPTAAAVRLRLSGGLNRANHD
jgi:hypothetical protein